jgi:hypothetical protein
MKRTLLFVLLFLTLAIFNSGCQLFDKDEQIPSYVIVDSVVLTPNYPDFGTSSHNISDVWVYANDASIGCFELPARIPILAEGSTKLTFSAGIKVNGMAATRATYPFYSTKTYQITLTPGMENAVRIKPVFDFHPSSVVTYNEDFESAGIIFEKTSSSDTTIMATHNPGEVFVNTMDPTEISNYSGVIDLTTEKSSFQIQNINAYTLPKNGTYAFLELNYNCTTPFHIGILPYPAPIGSSAASDLVGVNPTDGKWKKIYVNLTTAISGASSGYTTFKVFFTGSLTSGHTSDKILLDNIKLIHAATAKK